MKRFMLFGGPRYYPTGGAYDLIGFFDTLDEATAMPARTVVECYRDDTLEVQTLNDDAWWHVLDLVSGQIVATGCDRDGDPTNYPSEFVKSAP